MLGNFIIKYNIPAITSSEANCDVSTLVQLPQHDLLAYCIQQQVELSYFVMTEQHCLLKWVYEHLNSYSEWLLLPDEK